MESKGPRVFLNRGSGDPEGSGQAVFLGVGKVEVGLGHDMGPSYHGSYPKHSMYGLYTYKTG